MKFSKFTFTISLFFFANLTIAQTWQKSPFSTNSTLTPRTVTKKLKVRWSPNSEPIEQTVAIVGEKVVLEGDMVLGNVDDIFDNGRGVVTNINGQRWPNSTIPYVIAADHVDVPMIQAAINMIIRGTNICMIPRTTETDYVEFVNSNFCTSQIGRQGGRQEIQASTTCGVGVIAHEILHAAGHFHEQSRSDRDDFVKINLENVAPAFRFNFNIATVGTDIGAYDYHSIMHYDPYTLSANGLPTVELITPGAHPPNIGQAIVLSEGNINTTNSIYPSQPSCSLIPLPGNLNFQTAGTLSISGTNVTLSNMIIENNGNTALASATANFLIVGSDQSFTTIGTLPIPPLNPGATYPLNAIYNINNLNFVPNGTYTFGIWLNPTGAVVEATPKDNLHRWHTATSTKQPTTCPDLAINELVVNSYSTNAISFNYKYKNIGTATADVDGPTASLSDNANIRVALSADRIFDAGDQLIGEIPMTIDVFTSGIYTGSRSYSGGTINTTTHPYLVLQIDGNSLVTECNENNNDFAVRIAPEATVCSHPDFATLVAIYNALDGDNWTYNFNWDITGQTSCNPCQDNWYGVECIDDQVQELHLESNNLTGTIPTAIANLYNLSILYLGDNNLSGCIPDEFSVFCDNNTDVDLTNNPNLDHTNFSTFCSANMGACSGGGGGNAPSNDDCVNAIPLEVNIACDGRSYTNIGATTSPETPGFDCSNEGSRKDIWFTAVVPSSGNLTIETYQLVDELTDMVMQTYTGTCNNLTALICQDDIDAGNANYHAKVALTNQTPNTTIYIRIITYNSETEGEFGICAYDPIPMQNCADLNIAEIAVTGYTSNSISFNYIYNNRGNITAVVNHPNTTVSTFLSQDMVYDATDIFISKTALFSNIPAGGNVVAATSVSSSQLNINPNTHPYFILMIDADNYLNECSENNNTYVIRIDDCSASNSTWLSNSIGNGSYVATTNLSGDCIIESDKTVQMRSGNSINLVPGFHAKAGADLRLHIDDCHAPNFTSTPNTVNQRQATYTTTSAVLDLEKNDLSIAPNPMHTQSTIDFNLATATEVHLQIVNLNGQALFQQRLQGQAGPNQHQIDVHNLPVGTYVLLLQTPTNQLNEKIVIMR